MVDISIVVPVYNVEEYLNKCIDSLIAQTFKNIEIILVEDCSTDKSKQICKDYESKYENIKLIYHSKNMGLAQARNTGISVATGKYIAFVDSDDWVKPNMYELLYRKIENENLDIVVCGYEEAYDDEKYVTFKFSQYKNIENNIDIMKSFLGGKINAVAWNKLYKLSLFKNNNILYPEGKYYEDQYPTFLLLYNSTRVGFINEPLYYYKKRSSSITGNKFSNKNLDIIDQTNQIRKYLIENGEFENYKQYYQVRYINNVSSFVIDKLIKSNQESMRATIKMYKEFVKDDFNKNTYMYLKNKELLNKTKIKVFFIKNLFIIYAMLLRYR